MDMSDVLTIATLPGTIGRYLMMLRVRDLLDMAIVGFVFYKILTLMKSTRAASLLKGVLVFLAALMLSYILQMRRPSTRRYWPARRCPSPAPVP